MNNKILKGGLFCLLFSFTACNNEEEPVSNCILLAEEIQEVIRWEQINQTRIIASDFVRSGEGTPRFDGCIARYQDVFYNLDQLISFEFFNSTIYLRFP